MFDPNEFFNVFQGGAIPAGTKMEIPAEAYERLWFHAKLLRRRGKEEIPAPPAVIEMACPGGRVAVRPLAEEEMGGAG